MSITAQQRDELGSLAAQADWCDGRWAPFSDYLDSLVGRLPAWAELEAAIDRYIEEYEHAEAGVPDDETHAFIADAIHGLLYEGDVIAALESAFRPPSEPVDYTPGKWFVAHTAVEMEAFFRSRLPAIREAAREHGYAIGLHGSMRRDLDLIAVPWRDGAGDADTLARAIQHAACGITRSGSYGWEKKPRGRVATAMPICWTTRYGIPSDGHIDLSVASPPPERSPMTIEKIIEIGNETHRAMPDGVEDYDELIAIVRAVERHHRIGGEE